MCGGGPVAFGPKQGGGLTSSTQANFLPDLVLDQMIAKLQSLHGDKNKFLQFINDVKATYEAARKEQEAERQEILDALVGVAQYIG